MLWKIAVCCVLVFACVFGLVWVISSLIDSDSYFKYEGSVFDDSDDPSVLYENERYLHTFMLLDTTRYSVALQYDNKNRVRRADLYKFSTYEQKYAMSFAYDSESGRVCDAQMIVFEESSEKSRSHYFTAKYNEKGELEHFDFMDEGGYSMLAFYLLHADDGEKVVEISVQYKLCNVARLDENYLVKESTSKSGVQRNLTCDYDENMRLLRVQESLDAQITIWNFEYGKDECCFERVTRPDKEDFDITVERNSYHEVTSFKRVSQNDSCHSKFSYNNSGFQFIDSIEQIDGAGKSSVQMIYDKDLSLAQRIYKTLQPNGANKSIERIDTRFYSGERMTKTVFETITRVGERIESTSVLTSLYHDFIMIPNETPMIKEAHQENKAYNEKGELINHEEIFNAYSLGGGLTGKPKQLEHLKVEYVNYSDKYPDVVVLTKNEYDSFKNRIKKTVSYCTNDEQKHEVKLVQTEYSSDGTVFRETVYQEGVLYSQEIYFGGISQEKFVYYENGAIKQEKRTELLDNGSTDRIVVKDYNENGVMSEMHVTVYLHLEFAHVFGEEYIEFYDESGELKSVVTLLETKHDEESGFFSVIGYEYAKVGGVVDYTRFSRVTTWVYDASGKRVETVIVNYDQNGNPII